MAVNNEKISKKMATAYLKGIKSTVESLNTQVPLIKEYLTIDDGLKQKRIEWVFGVPQLQSKQNFRTRLMESGLEKLDVISDEYISFRCTHPKTAVDGFLGQLAKARGKMESQCVAGLRALITMCIEDADVARYIWD